jgi:fibronectin-binding autotransporter adhesin
MKKKYSISFLVKALLVLIVFVSVSKNAHAATVNITAGASNWSAITTGTGGGGLPGAGDNVVLATGAQVTINVANALCANLTFTAGVTATGITITGTNVLTVNSAVTMNTPSANVIYSINVGAGTFNAGSVSLLAVATAGRFTNITSTTGTVTVSGNITAAGTSSRFLFQGAGTLNIGGSLMTGTAGTLQRSTGTVNYNGTAQTVSNYAYFNLTISNSGIKTLAANTAMTGVLTIASGCTLAMVTFTITTPTGVVLETIGSGTGAIITSTNATAIITLGGTLSVTNSGATAITTGAVVGCGIALGANRTFNVAEDGSGTSSIDLTITGIISGGFTLLKQGGGELMLSGVNTFTGAITVENGTLLAGVNAPSGAAGAFGNATSTITLGNAATTTNNYAVALWLNGANSTMARTVTIANQPTTGGYNIGSNINSNTTLSGAITFNQPFTVTQVATSGTKLTISGGIVTATNSAKTITFDIAGDVLVGTGVIAQATGTTSLLKKGIGILTLSSANAYTGTTTISGGSLVAGANIAVSTAGPFGNSAAAIIMGDGATTTDAASPALLIGGAFTCARDVTITDNATSGTYSVGGSTANASSFTSASTITTSQPFSVTQITGGTLTLQGGITGGTAVAPAKLVTFNNVGGVTVNTTAISDGTGTISINKLNTGTLLLSLAQTFTGSATLTAGALSFSVANVINTASSFIINGGSINNTTGAGLTMTSTPITWGGSFALTGQSIQMGGAVTMTTDIQITVPTTVTLTIPGLINDAVHDLTKAGAGSVAFVSQAVQVHDLIISAGTLVSTSGDLSIAGDFSNSGTFTHNSGTVSFNGSGAHVINGSTTTAFNNVNTDLGCLLTAGAAATIAGTLIINDGTSFTAGAFALTVSGALTVGNGASGIFTISSATGTKTFNGAVTVQAGATWNNTAANAALTFVDNLTNNGTFNAGTGVHTFNSAGKTINGVLAIPNLTISAATTNNAVLTVTTALSGTSTLTQGTGAILYIGGTSGITGLAATANPNTVIYSANGAQTVKGVNYSTLHLMGSSTNIKTLATGTTAVTNLVISGTASATTVVALAISGDVTILGNGELIAAAFALTVGGTTTLGDGSLTAKLTISSATGTKSFNGDVVVNAGSLWGNAVNAALIFPGSLTNNGAVAAFSSGTNTHTFSGTNKTLNGLLAIQNVTVSGTVSNTGTLTVTGTLAGAGALKQDPGSILSIDVTPTITTLLAESVGNIVNYTSASAQTIKLANYYNLVFSGAGVKTTSSGTYNVLGYWSTTGGNAALNTNNTNLAAAGDILGAGNITMGSGTLSVGSAWANSGSFAAGTSTVNYNGTSSQTIGAINYNNLTVSGDKGAGVMTLATGTIGVLGNFNTATASNIASYVTTGNTVDFNGTGAQTIGSFNFNNVTVSNNKSGNATSFASATIGIAGALTVSGASNTSFVFTGSTFDYNGTGAQQVEAFNYENLTISNARGGAAVTFSTTGTIGISSVFDVTATGAVYTVTNSTVNYNGGGTQTIFAPFTYYDLVVSNAGVKNIVASTVVTCRTITIAGTAQITVPSTPNPLVVTL